MLLFVLITVGQTWLTTIFSDLDDKMINNLFQKPTKNELTVWISNMVPVYCCPKRVLVIHNSLIKTTPFHQSQFILWSRVVNCGSQEVAVCSNSAMLQCYLTPIWQCFVLNNGVLRNNWDLFKFCHTIALLFDNNSMKENGFLFCFWNAFYIKIKIDPLLPDGCVCVFF